MFIDREDLFCFDQIRTTQICFQSYSAYFVSKCITLSCVKASLRSYVDDIYDILGIDTVIIGLLIPKGGVFDDWIRILQLKCVKKVKLHFSFL